MLPCCVLQIWGLHVSIRRFHVKNPSSGPESIKYYYHGLDSGPLSYIIIMVCLWGSATVVGGCSSTRQTLLRSYAGWWGYCRRRRLLARRWAGSWPLWCWNYFEKHKDLFICQLWDGAGSWNPSSWKTRTCLSCSVSAMADVDWRWRGHRSS